MTTTLHSLATPTLHHASILPLSLCNAPFNQLPHLNHPTLHHPSILSLSLCNAPFNQLPHINHPTLHHASILPLSLCNAPSTNCHTLPTQPFTIHPFCHYPFATPPSTNCHTLTTQPFITHPFCHSSFTLPLTPPPSPPPNPPLPLEIQGRFQKVIGQRPLRSLQLCQQALRLLKTPPSLSLSLSFFSVFFLPLPASPSYPHPQAPNPLLTIESLLPSVPHRAAAVN